MTVKIDKNIEQKVNKSRDKIMAFLKDIIEHDSESANKPGVDWVGERITAEMPKGFTKKIVRHEKYGDHLIFSHLRPPLLPVVLGGHMDTLSPSGFDKLTVDGEFLRGPGTADMKGGLVVMIWALKILDECGLLDSMPAVCIFNSDEEVNSPTSKDLFTGRKGKASAGIIFECAGPDNSAVTTRRGIDVFDLVVKGRPGHSGLLKGAKSNAILEAAHKVIQIEALNCPDKSLMTNVGMISGGIAYNSIPENVNVTLELRYWDPGVGEKAMAELKKIIAAPAVPGCSMTLKRRTFRPPMRPDAACKSLYQTALDVASALGQPLPPEERGGGSDASWMAHVGIPSIDGLGPIGFDDFTDQERIVAGSLFERIILTANLLLNIEYRKAV